MTALYLGEVVLRLFGVIYAVAAVFLLNQLRTHVFMDRAISELDRMSEELAAESGAPAGASTPNDSGRTWWMVAGGVLLLAAGVAMALGLRVSVIALGALVVQQLAYFVRQRRRELAARSDEEAEDERPAQSTRNGFLFCLVLFVLAAWLERSGVLT
jgi:uncharacterized membrane protein YphA (DoxX/SURF4 family)